jgi:hypothetical protein
MIPVLGQTTRVACKNKASVPDTNLSLDVEDKVYTRDKQVDGLNILFLTLSSMENIDERGIYPAFPTNV